MPLPPNNAFHYSEQDYQRAIDAFHEANKAAVTAGQGAIRLAVGINGAAVIALLAFFGGLWGDPEVSLRMRATLASSMAIYATGVAFGGASAAGAYFTERVRASIQNAILKAMQRGQSIEKIRKVAPVRWIVFITFSVITITVGVASYIAFVEGSLTARDAIIQSNTVDPGSAESRSQ